MQVIRQKAEVRAAKDLKLNDVFIERDTYPAEAFVVRHVKANKNRLYLQVRNIKTTIPDFWMVDSNNAELEILVIGRVVP